MHRWALAALAALGVTLGLETSAGAVASAEMGTNSSYRYGRFEARIQFPQADGVIGSFFLWKNGSEMSGTYWNELDYEKIRADCALQLNAIFGLPQASHESLATGLTTTCTDYHLYAFEWTPSYIAWQVDGVEVRRDGSATAQAFADNATAGMQLRFNIWPGDSTFGGTFSASSLPLYQLVSWVAYSAYTPGTGDNGTDFALRWRESFDGGLPSGWLTGNWASPLGHSTHSPANVLFANGIAVLALTADGATGSLGYAPPDDGEDMPTVHVPISTGGAGGSTSTGAAGAGGGGSSDDDGGCGCTVPGGGGSGTALLALALLLARGRRRPRD